MAKSRDYGYQVVIRDLNQFDTVYIIPLADLHLGYPDIALDVFQGYLDWVLGRDNAFIILNGDLLNCATKDSTPDLFEDLVTPDEAYIDLLNLLKPVSDRILMITRGGHEEAIFRKVGTDYMAHLARELGDIPYKPNGGMVGLRMSKHNHSAMVYIYATHGWGGARTIGAKVKKARDLLAVANADIYILSHDHTMNVNRGNILEPPRSKTLLSKTHYMTVRRKLFCNTGGFIKYSGYVQRKGYDPQDLGTVRIRIEIKKSQSLFYVDLHTSI